METKRRGRYWVPLAIMAAALVILLLAVSGLGTLLIYSARSFPEDDLGRVRHILAFNRISCPHVRQIEGRPYGEGTIAVGCSDPASTTYVVFAELPCSEPAGCAWFEVLCWRVEKH
jgi:hypothetical protein